MALELESLKNQLARWGGRCASCLGGTVNCGLGACAAP